MAVLVGKLANGTSYVVFAVCFLLAMQYSRSLGENDFYLIPSASHSLKLISELRAFLKANPSLTS